jgi:hypothetical protein
LLDIHDDVHPTITDEKSVVQTHFMLESRPSFRLTSYWKRLVVRASE